jgi:hypothetical protein
MKVKWRELPKLLSTNSIDALVLDDYDFHGEVLPIYLGMPYNILANALHFDYSGSTQRYCASASSSATNTGATRFHGIGGDSEVLFPTKLTKYLTPDRRNFHRQNSNLATGQWKMSAP